MGPLEEEQKLIQLKRQQYEARIVEEEIVISSGSPRSRRMLQASSPVAGPINELQRQLAETKSLHEAAEVCFLNRCTRRFETKC